MPPVDRRDRLLEASAGLWVGSFIRLGPDGKERERFPTRLLVHELDGESEAALTDVRTGREAKVRFADPPVGMEIPVRRAIGASARTGWDPGRP